jgi:APA family basic amino acid/polyamine antiporter
MPGKKKKGIKRPSGTSRGKSGLFMRKATGLVRSWSVFDAFIYATFSINLVTLGLYIFSQMYFLQGGMLPTLLISGVFILFEVVVYAGMIAVMPRSGGDYIWQSRILGGGIGFVLAVTGWWFILWLWVPLYADMLRYIVFAPLLGILGARDLALWFVQSAWGFFTTCLILCALVTLYIAVGMKAYARIQKVCFWGGIIGIAIVMGLLLFGNHAAFKAGLENGAQSIFGAQAGAYDATVEAGTAAGAALPLSGGGLAAIFLAMPYIVFFNLWPNWGATLYGEVRGATDFKRNFWGMAWALIFTTALGAVLLLLIARTMSWDFYVQANGAWWNFKWGYTDQAPPLPTWPYPALLAVFMVPNRLVQFIVLLLMSLWWFGWSGTVFLSSTRVIFAAAFDRLLPDKVADVEPRTRTPIYALALMVLPSLVVSALWAWNVGNFQSLTLASTLVIAVTYLGTSIAATILPFRKPDLYNASPIVKYRIGKIPLITIAGAIFSAFLIFLLGLWLLDPNKLYGLVYVLGGDGNYHVNISSLIYMGSMYLLALIIYLGFRQYRKRQGIDIGKVHREIPVE